MRYFRPSLIASLLALLVRHASGQAAVQAPVYINAGSAAIVDDENIVWEPDSSFVNGGSVLYPRNGLVFVEINGAISGRDDLYKQERFDRALIPDMTYSIPLLAGTYDVDLHFAEVFSGAMGDGLRVFNVMMEGEIVFSNVDIYNAVGGHTAYIRSKRLEVTDGFLTVEFMHITENPKICALSVTPVVLPPDVRVQPIFDVYINAGRSTDYTDADLIVWEADRDFNTGRAFGRTAAAISGDISDPTIYQTERFDYPYQQDLMDLEYSIQVVPDHISYTVTLHFAELYYPRIGQRIFDVEVEGRSFLDNYDIVEQAGGQYVAITETTAVTVRDGVLNIVFRQVKENPKISAIEIHAAPEADATPTSTPTSSPAPTAPVPVEILINSGGPTFEDDDGNTWLADSETGYVSGGVPYATRASISGNSSIEQLYKSERFGSMTYVIDDLENGDYDVYLHFAEIYHGAMGLRLFGVKIQGADIFESGPLDVFAAAGGKNIAYVEHRRATVTEGGELTIELTTVVNNAKISGIEIRSATEKVWTELAEPPATTARHECSFVQVGDHFYLFGGRENPQLVDIYNPFTKIWTQATSTAPQPFNHFQATAYQGLVWVVMSFVTNEFPVEVPAEHVYIYDPADDVWILGPKIPAARRRGGVAFVVYQDKFYLCGGNTIGHTPGAVDWLDEYDPVTGIWRELPDAPRARDHFHSVVAGTKMYAAGGRRSAAPGLGTFSDVEPEVDVFDLDTMQWLTTNLPDDLPNPRAAPGIVVFHDKILLMGGETLASLPALTASDETHELDLVTGAWTQVASLNRGRHGTQAIASGEGVYIVAGSPNLGGGNIRSLEVYNKDEPEGVAIVPASISAAASMEVPFDVPTPVSVLHSGGNQGVVVTSMAISGTYASNFTLMNGFPDPLLIPVGGQLTDVFIQYLGDSSGVTAQLDIEFHGNEMWSIELVGTAPTSAPVANMPETSDQVTGAPVTNAPVTGAPITGAPVTNAPVTGAPVTNAPVTSAPVSSAPITSAPGAMLLDQGAPVSASPITASPITASPVTLSPVTLSPVTSSPITLSPVTSAPVTPAPPSTPSSLTITDVLVVDATNSSFLSPLDMCDDCLSNVNASIVVIPFGVVGSVNLTVSGPAMINDTTLTVNQGQGPFSLFGNINDDIVGVVFPPGTYNITVQAFSEPNAQGMAGHERTESFSVAESVGCGQQQRRLGFNLQKADDSGSHVVDC